MTHRYQLLVTCEHGGHKVPSRYQSLFVGKEELLLSHRGWDPGALAIAKEIAKELGVPLHFTEVTRLLVETNRSLHHPQLFSSVTKDLTPAEKKAILDRYYTPYRQSIEETIRHLIHTSPLPVLHLSIHSFTPVLEGEVRECEIGLLYDPKRIAESSFIESYKLLLKSYLLSNYRVRLNYPYRGTADGLTTFFRKKFDDRQYLGVEVEINQGLIAKQISLRNKMTQALIAALQPMCMY